MGVVRREPCAESDKMLSASSTELYCFAAAAAAAASVDRLPSLVSHTALSTMRVRIQIDFDTQRRVAHSHI